MYQIIYFDGKLASINRQNDDGSSTSFGVDPKNKYYQEFLEWNAKQSVALDITADAPIEVTKELSQLDLLRLKAKDKWTDEDIKLAVFLLLGM